MKATSELNDCVDALRDGAVANVHPLQMKLDGMLNATVQVSAAREDRLRKHSLHFNTVPILPPATEKVELAGTEQPRLVDQVALRAVG